MHYICFLIKSLIFGLVKKQSKRKLRNKALSIPAYWNLSGNIYYFLGEYKFSAIISVVISYKKIVQQAQNDGVVH